ncbi:helix-turn-helix domain-containing protein [Xanthobacter dioxanivorans]|uniref:Helix-turn-helix domain-containing protein n=1 Tax=Xanthobacter dioxanivorans TaxID=2528964 RepID=A0A974SHI1_9HYPH|nr:helix-turn-helix domain-containing protein [Xanthobacter dioxanivorans]QRG05392.1 helix-turn-helix domain-containing protein [Xanthobacter dioxanivorans]
MSHSAVTGRQIKAARVLLGWTRADLADRAGVTAETVKVVEKDEVTLEALASTRSRLCRTLEAGGVTFLNGGSTGVQVQPKDEGLRPEDLNASNDG